MTNNNRKDLILSNILKKYENNKSNSIINNEITYNNDINVIKTTKQIFHDTIVNKYHTNLLNKDLINKKNLKVWKQNQIIARDRKDLRNRINNQLNDNKMNKRMNQLYNEINQTMINIDLFDKRLENNVYKDNELDQLDKTINNQLTNQLYNQTIEINQQIKDKSMNISNNRLINDKNRRKFLSTRENFIIQSINELTTQSILINLLNQSNYEIVNESINNNLYKYKDIFVMNALNRNDMTESINNNIIHENQLYNKQIVSYEYNYINSQLDSNIDRLNIYDQSIYLATQQSNQLFIYEIIDRILDLTDIVCSYQSFGIFNYTSDYNKLSIPSNIYNDLQLVYSSDLQLPDPLVYPEYSFISNDLPYSLSYRPLCIVEQVVKDDINTTSWLFNNIFNTSFIFNEDITNHLSTVDLSNHQLYLTDYPNNRLDSNKSNIDIYTDSNVDLYTWFISLDSRYHFGEVLLSLRMISNPILDKSINSKVVTNKQINQVLDINTDSPKNKLLDNLLDSQIDTSISQMKSEDTNVDSQLDKQVISQQAEIVDSKIYINEDSNLDGEIDSKIDGSIDSKVDNIITAKVEIISNDKIAKRLYQLSDINLDNNTDIDNLYNSFQIRLAIFGLSDKLKRLIAQELKNIYPSLVILSTEQLLNDFISNYKNFNVSNDLTNYSNDYVTSYLSIGKEILDLLEEGRCISDNIYVWLLVNAIRDIDNQSTGYIITDYPNTIDQSILLFKYLSNGINYKSNRPQISDNFSNYLSYLQRDKIIYDSNLCGITKFIYLSNSIDSYILESVSIRKNLLNNEDVYLTTNNYNLLDSLDYLQQPYQPTRSNHLASIYSYEYQRIALEFKEFLDQMGLLYDVSVDEIDRHEQLAIQIANNLVDSLAENKVDNQVDSKVDEAFSKPNRLLKLLNNQPNSLYRDLPIPNQLANMLSNYFNIIETQSDIIGRSIYRSLRDVKHYTTHHKRLLYDVISSYIIIPSINHQIYLSNFITNYNQIENDLLYDSDMINENILRVNELVYLFISSSYNKYINNKKLLDSLTIESNYLTKLNSYVYSLGIILIQNELNRFIVTINIYFDCIKSISSNLKSNNLDSNTDSKVDNKLDSKVDKLDSKKDKNTKSKDKIKSIKAPNANTESTIELPDRSDQSSNKQYITLYSQLEETLPFPIASDDSSVVSSPTSQSKKGNKSTKKLASNKIESKTDSKIDKTKPKKNKNNDESVINRLPILPSIYEDEQIRQFVDKPIETNNLPDPKAKPAVVKDQPPVFTFESVFNQAISQLDDYKEGVYTTQRIIYNNDESLCQAIDKAIWFEVERYRNILNFINNNINITIDYINEQERSIISILSNQIQSTYDRELANYLCLLDKLCDTILVSEPIIDYWLITSDTFVIQSNRQIISNNDIAIADKLDSYTDNNKLSDNSIDLLNKYIQQMKIGDKILVDDFNQVIDKFSRLVGPIDSQVSSDSTVYQGLNLYNYVNNQKANNLISKFINKANELKSNCNETSGFLNVDDIKSIIDIELNNKLTEYL